VSKLTAKSVVGSSTDFIYLVVAGLRVKKAKDTNKKRFTAFAHGQNSNYTSMNFFSPLKNDQLLIEVEKPLACLFLMTCQSWGLGEGVGAGLD